MDYSGWPQPQQNPNPVLWQTTDYSAYNPHNLNADPYQQPYIAPQNALIQPYQAAVPPQIPQPQHHIAPPGVDTTPYVAQQVPVQYPEQTYYYEHQPAPVAVPGSYYPDPNSNWTSLVCQYGPSPTPTGVAAPNPVPAIQFQMGKPKRNVQKKLKVEPAWCEICQIDCNSKDVLDQHKLGKKHKKNLNKLKHMPVHWPSGVATYPTVVPTYPTMVASSSTVAADAPVATAATLTTVATSSIPPAFTPAPSLPDTITTSTPLVKPDLGLINQSIIGPEENPNKPKVTSAKRSRRNRALPLTGDLEMKKRKVLEGGAAANSVRACDICNVVCNSDTVYNYHLAGQRHASMVKKHASRAGIAFAT